jgi:rubredoxin
MNNCPMCNGEPNLLGSLGNLTRLRCRNCGLDYNPSNTDFDYNDFEEADYPIGDGEVFYSRSDVESYEDEF